LKQKEFWTGQKKEEKTIETIFTPEAPSEKGRIQ
jgi:hypothetical protein